MPSTIRPARPSDIPQIRLINTHYILNTALTFVQHPPVAATYLAKYEDLTSRGLPYLVAVDGNTKSADGGDDGDDSNDGDLVLGYAYLSPFRRTMLSYASTVELTLYIRSGYQSKRLGSRLLDAVLDAARTARHLGWEVMEETDTEGVHLQQGRSPEGKKQGQVVAVDPEDGGAGARISNIIAIMAVDPEGPEQGEALRRWYVARGFVEKGRMEKIGFKRGHWVDTVYLQFML
ncbi:hypothetical protein BJY01DRAFT_138631 [Aspergillus pseudoustus]|uniref:N-acetyltransferase domain-containing protein n=1 Tax=Aspergillus pseudoustus TaxID=1810923 RepID=A0ABR4KC74_9EURO